MRSTNHLLLSLLLVASALKMSNGKSDDKLPIDDFPATKKTFPPMATLHTTSRPQPDFLEAEKHVTKSDECDCGLFGHAQSRIIGGNETRPNEYPWTVALFESFSDRFPVCMGVLISNTHILTAAHCIESVYIRYVLLGAHDVTVRPEHFPGQRVSYMKEIEGYNNDNVIHPKYNNGGGKKFPGNDLAVLVLKRPLDFRLGYPNVRPICLPASDRNTDPDRTGKRVKAIVAGWGRTHYKGAQSRKLMSVELEVLTNSECNKRFSPSLGGIQPYHLCAFAEGKDACQGDSGGALFTEKPTRDLKTKIKVYELIGIVSFGERCGSGKPGGFTRVSYYMNWIVDKMAEQGQNVVTAKSK